MELVIALIGVFGTIFGALVGHFLSNRDSSKNDLKNYMTETYSEILAEYLLFADGQSTRSRVISPAKRALLLCPEEMEMPLNRLINSVMYVTDIRTCDMTECTAAYCALDEAVTKAVQKLWSTKKVK